MDEQGDNAAEKWGLFRRAMQASVAWRVGNVRSAARTKRPSPTEMVTMGRRMRLLASAVTPVRWHRRRCLCYGCYL